MFSSDELETIAIMQKLIHWEMSDEEKYEALETYEEMDLG